MPFSPASVLAKIIEEREQDIRLRNAKTLDLLSTRNRVRTAETVDLNWNVILVDSATATSAMTVAGVDQNTGDTVQATLGIGGHKVYHQFSINRVDMVDASKKGTSALKRLFKTHVDAGLLAIRKRVNELIWIGDGTAASGGFVGFGQVLDPAVSYAGINPATWTNWVPIINTNGTARALTKTLLNAIHTEMDIQEVGYDTIICHPNTAQRYRELFENTAGIYQNINSAEKGVVDLYGGQLSWNGIPILTDRFCPAGRLVFADTSYIDLMSFDLADSDQGQLEDMGLKDNFNTMASVEVGGLRINVALLPQTNPGTLQFQLFVIPQMRVLNRRMVQGILNLT